MVRDGRDVALSLGGLSWGSRHIPRIAQDWRWKTVLAHKIGTVLGERFLEVRFEDASTTPSVSCGASAHSSESRSTQRC